MSGRSKNSRISTFICSQLVSNTLPAFANVNLFGQKIAKEYAIEQNNLNKIYLRTKNRNEVKLYYGDLHLFF